MQQAIDFILRALKGTPLWVFLLFAYLIIVGIRALRPHVVPLYRLFLLPTFFAIIGFFSAMGTCQSSLEIVYWAVALLVGAFFGWLMWRRVIIQVDKERQLLKLPGSSVTLILVLLIFSIKYIFGYLHATGGILNVVGLCRAEIIISGVITGMLAGRGLTFYRKFLSA